MGPAETKWAFLRDASCPQAPPLTVASLNSCEEGEIKIRQKEKQHQTQPSSVSTGRKRWESRSQTQRGRNPGQVPAEVLGFQVLLLQSCSNPLLSLLA